MTESQRNPPPRSKAHPLRPVLVLIVVFGAWLGVTGVSKWWVGKELVPWQSDLSAAQAQSRSSGKPVLLYFTATWCAPCQEMRRSVWTDERVAAAAAKFVPVKIDFDRNQKLATQYRVETLPLLLVLADDGRPISALDHGVDAEEMTAWLTKGDADRAGK